MKQSGPTWTKASSAVTARPVRERVRDTRSAAGSMKAVATMVVSLLCRRSTQSPTGPGVLCSQVLVGQFAYYYTCDDYCKAIGSACKAAWEESGESCTVKSTMNCGTTIDSSDAICECYPGAYKGARGGLPAETRRACSPLK